MASCRLLSKWNVTLRVNFSSKRRKRNWSIMKGFCKPPVAAMFFGDSLLIPSKVWEGTMMFTVRCLSAVAASFVRLGHFCLISIWARLYLLEANIHGPLENSDYSLNPCLPNSWLQPMLKYISHSGPNVCEVYKLKWKILFLKTILVLVKAVVLHFLYRFILLKYGSLLDGEDALLWWLNSRNYL